eukprot:1448395-Rhodomonas_salina.2
MACSLCSSLARVNVITRSPPPIPSSWRAAELQAHWQWHPGPEARSVNLKAGGPDAEPASGTVEDDDDDRDDHDDDDHDDDDHDDDDHHHPMIIFRVIIIIMPVILRVSRSEA